MLREKERKLELKPMESNKIEKNIRLRETKLQQGKNT